MDSEFLKALKEALAKQEQAERALRGEVEPHPEDCSCEVCAEKRASEAEHKEDK